tara:strand:+ start:6471 stop:7253 length:783 start_codon:yes stop_codon:yes gene_type:complete
MSEIEVVYNTSDDTFLGIKLSDTSIHKSISFDKDGLGLLINVTAQDVVGENSNPQPKTLREVVSKITINESSYETPFDLSQMYEDIIVNRSVDDINMMVEEIQEEIPDTPTVINWWDEIIKGVTIKSMPDSNKLIMKAIDEVQQIAFDIIAEPNKLDAHGEWYSKDTLVKACENFNQNLLTGNVTPNLYHVQAETEKLQILKTFIVPVDCIIGEQEVVEGTWVSEMKYIDKALWDKKVSGEILGVSIGAMGKRIQPEELS